MPDATLNTISKFTGTQVFGIGFDNLPCTLIVKANGGSVQLDVQIDTALDEWITFDTYTSDIAYKLECNGCNVRIVCSGGAEAALVRP